MKILKVIKTVIHGIFVFSSLLFVQCTKTTSTEKYNFSILDSKASGLTTITGYVHNRDVYPTTNDITINVSHISGGNRVSQIKSPINDDGTFRFNIDLARPQDVTMPPHLDFLYLIPDDSLHIEIDFKDLTNVRLSGGKSAEINNDFYRYFNKVLYRTEHYNYHGVGTDCENNCSWAEIKQKSDEERNWYRQRRKEFLAENTVCDEVLFLTEAMIELDYYHRFVHTVMARTHRNKETMDLNLLMDELDEVAEKYFNVGLYSNSHFKFIAESYLMATYVTNKATIEDNTIGWVNKVAPTETIKDFMLTVMAGQSLLNRDLESFEKFSVNVANEYLLDRAMQEYRTVKMTMVSPENISAYILNNSTKEFRNNVLRLEDKNILAQKIEPNHGKVHIINISSAGCGPCYPVLEKLQKMKEEYADKDVVFSFICISSGTEETRERYRKRGIDDTKLHFCNNYESQFLFQTFSPLGFPYGILVNRKGVIVDYGFHLRPESDTFREKIELLLKQDNLVK